MKKVMLMLAVLLLFFGCARAQQMYSWEETHFSLEAAPVRETLISTANMRFSVAPETIAQNTTLNEGAAQYVFPANAAIERKLVRRANIRMRVENLDTASSSLEYLMERYGAYAASTTIDASSHRFTIRVPAPAYRDFLDEINGMGTILNRSESAEDVTTRFFDLEGRLATLQELLRTFQSYLGRAQNIEEILSVERRIAELQNEIDRTGGDLRSLLDRVVFSTIDLTMVGPVAVSMPGRDTTLSDRFKVFFDNFAGFLSVLLFAIIGIVLYGIPILLLGIFFYWVLFGKLGLLKKLWRAVADKKQKPEPPAKSD